ncbi:replicative DNA helicase [Bailinhaonella thermotolerans]|uniref:replicative DNA helicase n=1 Tax=Bailinhaonella thermotolerans TaxID=1070861 RepID=UPI00192A69BE|nr:replicative DNA helicase [Bailinhaonella thermotolerans]
MARTSTAPSFEPVDVDAEESVLAAVLTDPQCLDDVAGKIGPEDFSVAGYGTIFAAVRACAEAGLPCDPITVTAQLKKARALTRAGGREALEALLAKGAHVRNVAAHADIVADRALARRVIAAARQIATTAMAPECSGGDALLEAEKTVFALAAKGPAADLVDMPESVKQTLELIRRSRTQRLIGHSTGFAELDRLTAGLQPGQLVILAGRPAMGKTSLALQLALNMAADSGKTVPFFSHEMTHQELTMRALAMHMGYDLHRLRQGIVPQDMQGALTRAAEAVAAAQVKISDNPPATVSQLGSVLRRLSRKEPLAAAVIDYAQLMSGERRGREESRTNEIGEISRGAKRLAAELGIPIVLLSQLNRSLEARVNKRPVPSDLRESGSLEQDASLIMFVYRDAVYHPDSDPEQGELIIAKQRNGPAPVTIPLRWYGPASRWDDAGQAFTEPAAPQAVRQGAGAADAW